ncbi:Mitochondrial Rho GTPase 1 [Orobanche gracilis]
MAGKGVRIVVAGDAKTGKSSLIVTAAAKSFPTNVPPLLPPTRLPVSLHPEVAPVTIIDICSSPENRDRLVEDLTRADAVVLTYACDRPETLDRLSTHWLPELRRLEVKVPVIVVGCMLDKRGDQQPFSLEQVMSPIVQHFHEIETCIECSALNHIKIPEVFYNAQKAVLYPTAPLCDKEQRVLKPRYMRALKRIFILCDHDRDGALSDAEFNDFQVKCFNAPLQASEMVDVKRVVQEKLREGVDDRGLTLMGFVFLHASYIQNGRLETTWTALRKFGYNNELRLRDDQLLPPIKRYPDQSVELTTEAMEFLKKIFFPYGRIYGVLHSHEVEDLFSTAPENPWNEAPYVDAAEKTSFGGLCLDGFLSLWALMTLLDPIRSVENLIYIGYGSDPSSAIRVTRRRRLDRKKQQTERTVHQCFVFGPKKSGKSTLLNALVGRSFPEEYVPITGNRYAVNVMNQPAGVKKIIVLQEIPEEGVKELLSKKDALAACDLAMFFHDSSRESSWEKAAEMLVDVASQGEATGYEVPCLIVAAKDDLVPYSIEIQDSTRVSRDMGIEAPIPLSNKVVEYMKIFSRVLRASEQPHLSIPETADGKSHKRLHRLLNRSLVFISAGAAVAHALLGLGKQDAVAHALLGLGVCRVYAARRNSSS